MVSLYFIVQALQGQRHYKYLAAFAPLVSIYVDDLVEGMIRMMGSDLSFRASKFRNPNEFTM
jgi:UDP-glucuronate decarboxylase